MCNFCAIISAVLFYSVCGLHMRNNEMTIHQMINRLVWTLSDGSLETLSRPTVFWAGLGKMNFELLSPDCSTMRLF